MLPLNYCRRAAVCAFLKYIYRPEGKSELSLAEDLYALLQCEIHLKSFQIVALEAYMWKKNLIENS